MGKCSPPLNTGGNRRRVARSRTILEDFPVKVRVKVRVKVKGAVLAPARLEQIRLNAQNKTFVQSGAIIAVGHPRFSAHTSGSFFLPFFMLGYFSGQS